MTDPTQKAEFNKRLFVAVHAGAGFHSQEKVVKYKDLCRRACLQAMCHLQKKKSAADAVTQAVSVLEDSELSNAGQGSNLTMSGTVECDASVMEGTTSLFGAVGCVSGILNPVQVACSLLRSQQHSSLSLGRVPPSVLVGTGAVEWAKQQGFACDDHHKLVTDNSNRLYRKYKRKVERAERQSSAKKARCGEAAMYGAGCWAQSAKEDLPGVAVITSGCGEHVMRTLLAKTCADCLLSVEDATEGFHVCFSKHFLESRLLSGVDRKLAGAVAVRTSQTEQGGLDTEVCWGHTTESMALGYLRGDGHTPKTLVSRLTEGCQPGHSFTMSSAFFSHRR